MYFSNGNVRARRMRLLKPVPAERFQGVVCSMKDTFGFIERSDVVKEIFFHYSEFQGNINELLLGDDVEFSIQTRNVSVRQNSDIYVNSLTHCSLVMPYGVNDSCQYWHRLSLDAWWHQAITWTNVDSSSVRTCDIRLRALSSEDLQIPISKTKFNIASRSLKGPMN